MAALAASIENGNLPAPEVSLIMLLETVLGPVWVWMVLHEVPPAGTYVGGVLVVGTLIVHSIMGLREARITHADVIG